MESEFRIYREAQTVHGVSTCDCMSFVQYNGRWVIAFESRCRQVTVVPGFYLGTLPLPEDEYESVFQKVSTEPVPKSERAYVVTVLKELGYLGPFDFREY